MAQAFVQSLIYINVPDITETSETCAPYSGSVTCAVAVSQPTIIFSGSFQLGSPDTSNGITKFSAGVTNNNLTFKCNDIDYIIKDVYFLSPSVNKYLTDLYTFEYVITFSSTRGETLIICIPVVVGDFTNISLSSGYKDLNNYIPSQKPFYWFNATSELSATTNLLTTYVVFPSTSSNLTISNFDYTSLCYRENSKCTITTSPVSEGTEATITQEQCDDFIGGLETYTYELGQVPSGSSLGVASGSTVVESRASVCSASNPSLGTANYYQYYTNLKDTNKGGQPIFYNNVGCNASSLDSDDIYIHCNPTDYEGNIINVDGKTGNPTSTSEQTSEGSNFVKTFGFWVVALISTSLFILFVIRSFSKISKL